VARESRDRHVWGATNPIYIAVKSAETIKTGDMVKCGAGVDVEPLDFAALSEDNDNFCGVAMQDSVSADPATIRVATTGVFEFDCASATFLAFETVMQTGGDAQKVVTQNSDITTVDKAVGRVWKRYSSATTKVWVKIDTVKKLSRPI